MSRNRLVALCSILLLLVAACQRRDEPKGPSSRERGDTAASGGASGGAIVLRDAEHQEVRLARPAERIISLAPSITEIVFALGAGPRLVGRTTYCDYPPAALSVPTMGDMLTLNYEAVLASRPDLVLMTHVGNIKSNYEKLRDLGLTACTIGDESIDGIIGTIDTIGMLTGRSREAALLGKELKRGIDSIAELARKGPRVSTFIVIDQLPLITASSGFLAEELDSAGADNIAKGGITAYPKYSREEVLRRDPEVIIVPGMSWKVAEDLLNTYPEWRRLRAVRNNRMYVLPHNTIFRPGPRIVRSMGLIYRALHGAEPKGLFEEAMR